MELDVTQMTKQSQWTSISQCLPKSDVLTPKQTRNAYRNKEDASIARSKATWHTSALTRRSNLSDPIKDCSARIGSRSDPVRHLPDPVSTSRRSPMDSVATVNVTCGLRVLREQLFLRLLLTTCRASEYTLDLESCLGTLRQS
jgi:hypothetical protein